MTVKTVFKDRESKVPVKVWTEDIDEKTQAQLENISKMPFIHKHVAVMPDAHLGIGCTIGTVLPTKGAIIPAAVGVDIGCGMMAVQTNIHADRLPDNLKPICHSIERSVPLGPGGRHQKDLQDVAWPRNNFISISVINHFFKDDPESMFGVQARNWRAQLGSLGGGNHFIEVCLDQNDRVWVMLHSGSRGIGNKIGVQFISKAREEMRRWFINLPDKDLAYLVEGTEHFEDYIAAVSWAQEYASHNRRVMMTLVFKELEHYIPNITATDMAINCHHNYVELENHFGENVYVTRKGAIRARGNDLGIIPGSMGTGSFIVRGKGNADSFHSCSHGAGRKMSRRAAFEKFNMTDMEEQTKGVEMNRRKAILDEVPGAYKDIDEVMANQEDLVEVVYRLKQVLNVKGD